MTLPLVTVLTASTGNPVLHECLRSVKSQTYGNIQHLVFVDGPDRTPAFMDGLMKSCVVPMDISTQKPGYRFDVINLPYAVGKDRWNGHRMYGAGSFLADGDFVMFLDDDNYLDVDHIESLMAVIQNGNLWSYSLRKIVDRGNVLCEDNCESLGKWPSILHPEDFFIDVNCFFLPRILAVQIAPLWFRKFREPGQPEVDRVLSHALRQITAQNNLTFDCSYKYSLSYTVGNSQFSVQKEFFDRGNSVMLTRYNNQLPWKK